MITFETILLAVAILLIISVLASKISARLSLPALLLFLFIGMLAGSEGIGGINFDDPLAAQSVGVVALIFILFAGGLDTPFEEARRVLARGILLSTIGVLLTAAVVGVFTYFLLDFPPIEAFLVGAIIASTDAAAVFSIMRTQRKGLKGDTKPLLEFESGSNDPMAIFLTVGTLEFIRQPDMPLIDLLVFFIQQMGIGVVMGYVIGRYATRIINRLRLEADGLYSVFTVSLVLLTYGLTTTIGGSGFMAAYVVGLVMGAQNFIHKNSLTRFHDALSWLMQIMLFLVLGLLVFPSRLLPVAIPGILIAAGLIFVARPVSVFLLLMFSKFDLRQKLMISWVGLRGATPIVLATFPLLAGIPQADVIFHIVFFVVLVSVLLQGSTIVPAANLLKVAVPLTTRPRYSFEIVPNEDIKSELVEVPVAEGAPSVGRQIVNLGLPEGSLIVLVERGKEIVVPNGNTVIEAGDVLLMLADQPALEEIRRRMAEDNATP